VTVPEVPEFQPDALEGALCDYLGLPWGDVWVGSFEQLERYADGTTVWAWEQFVDGSLITRQAEIPPDAMRQLREDAADRVVDRRPKRPSS
jgi:hypothetical protein